jgi:hypothetical protein
MITIRFVITLFTFVICDELFLHLRQVSNLAYALTLILGIIAYVIFLREAGERTKDV